MILLAPLLLVLSLLAGVVLAQEVAPAKSAQQIDEDLANISEAERDAQATRIIRQALDQKLAELAATQAYVVKLERQLTARRTANDLLQKAFLQCDQERPAPWGKEKKP